jgi:pimeloyl-ACP methyl ester carboxylesterase
MAYALNLFNFVPGKEDQYRRYSVLAGKIIYGLGGRVIAAGQTPLRYLHGDVERRQMIVVEFPSEEEFQKFLDEGERQQIHELREGATRDYIWTLFEYWDMRAWVRGAQTAAAASHEPRNTSPDTRPHLVLLPGLLCDGALWEPQIDGLADACRPWIADVGQDDSIAAMAARALRDAPADRFALAGLSMGGYVAMELLRQAPQRVTRLALLDTRARLDTPEETGRRMELIRLAQNERGFTPITSRMLPLLVHPSRLEDRALVEIIRGMAERTGVEGYIRQQHAIIGRPDARLTVLEDCGHLSTLEKPHEVNAALRAWLRGV